MLTQALLYIAALATQGFAIPTTGYNLVARQGYTANCTATYTIRLGDTCNKIRDDFNDVFTLADFYSWNPEVDSNCSNLALGEVVCIGVGNSTGTAPPPACPVPVKPGLVTDCDSCYKVVEGDSCAGVFTSNNITRAEFLAWNPDLNSGCTNLEIGYNYCVGVDA
ncbi:carbohydrate-binding module family 50 protein [Xylariaceae sp. AK1471]|nr:carbohydrate-binding module family 50 protein [Xylariaceae sp. AK1471]